MSGRAMQVSRAIYGVGPCIAKPPPDLPLCPRTLPYPIIQPPLLHPHLPPPPRSPRSPHPRKLSAYNPLPGYDFTA